MAKIIGILDKDLKWIISKIKEDFPLARIGVFGSRVTGNPKPRKYSDIDIFIDAKEKIEFARLANLQEYFEESDFPIMLDISDYCSFDEEFKNRVDQTALILS